MRPENLQAALTRIVARTPAFPGETLAVDIIANPRAGGFTRPKYAKKRFAELSEVEAKAAALPERSSPSTVALHLTERCGHAADIARAILGEARRESAKRRHIIVTAGGDGTSLETASALVDLPPEERGCFSLLRLPFGTGNDGSEGRELVTALSRFLGPCASRPRSAIRVVPNPQGGRLPLYSFNIASIGLDAYVCHMTNKLKTLFPGDSYKFWVDLSSVLYDRAWPTAPLGVKAYDGQGREVEGFERECLLFAMGASGRRTYGSGQRILPDDDNVCAVFQMPLLKKLEFKNRITSGQHRGLDVLSLFSARRIVFNYDRGILLQCDGEVSELKPADFPLAFELTEPLYNVLEPA